MPGKLQALQKMLIAHSGAFALYARAHDQSGPILFLNLHDARIYKSPFHYSRLEKQQ